MQFVLCGVLSETAGAERMEVDLPGPMRVDEALQHLVQRVPALEQLLPRVACAIGDELIPRSELVEDHQALVLLPPVSGG
ncbi:MAG: MoaD/ThiS family protein [Ectothiorhodospiraceae bacterium]|jgi:hypothetical protein